MNRYLAKLASLDEKRPYPSNPQNPQNPPKRGSEGFEGSLSSAFLPSATPPTELSETPEPAGDAAADDTEQAVACRMMMVGGTAERDPSPYASALAALRANCPASVPEDRWRLAIADATVFISEWREQAQDYGWAERDLLALHPTAPLSRVDVMGLIWLLRGRPVVALTATEAAYRCPSGAILKFYRRTEAAPADIISGTPAVAEIAKTKTVAPA
jgi:hypothetical protein